MQYRYFVELTEQVEHLRAQLAGRSGALFHDGLDLSHAFARQLYFAAAGDTSLYGLWMRSKGAAEPQTRALSAPAVALLARNWLGTAMPIRLRLRAALAPARLLAGRGLGTADYGSSAAVLLFAHSLRFARFLEPVAKRLGSRCAYLLEAGDNATRQWAARRGHAVRHYHSASRRWRRSGSALAQYAPGLALFAEEIETALANSGAKVVVVPEGNSPEDEIVSRVGARNRTAVVCLQQGWSPLIHTGFRNMSFTRMLVWGQGFADILARFNPDQSFAPVGNFHLPPAAIGVPRPHGLGFFCQGHGGWTRLKHQEQMIDLACMVAAELPHLPVVVRSHPICPFDTAIRNRLSAFSNVRISVPDEEPFANVMENISVGVSIYSSSLLECVASGVLPVVFNITDMPAYMPDLAGDGAGLELHTSEAAREALVTLMKSPAKIADFAPAMARFQRRFFAGRAGQALDEICGQVDRLSITGPSA